MRSNFHALNRTMRDESFSLPANGAAISSDKHAAISSGVLFAVQIIGSWYW
jgi:hypothetical protein